ncbi:MULTISPECIES: hypothetical protein [unclassified Pseudomonas]|jgi:hypothetical protein|uniref:hypothetical protein n=1 Tax=unclassified Pseudomonas TaxID=196821 RepID=UPI0019405C9E|nr:MULTISPECIES: hypothetical protein [unclassified Pseudomonas]MDC0689112.1 hypothetical protein [Mitsuaria sp. RG]MCE0914674.1 hypothetical protein [Pseudomonas sp. NMI760_13]MCP8633376.1 hypothetical protein [Pseudomonas sp. DVZ6]MDD7782881.1 hypothetical protein [Pseudomonas sp. DVZ24]BCJ06496.1 hypothetical protein PRtIB026_A37380 [Pseudomonas sp. RtIB026]
MLKLLTDIAFLCAGLLLLIALFWACTFERNRWRAAFEADFTTRLGNLGIDGYELVVDNVTLPTPHRAADVYRIFHDLKGNYFLYIKNGYAAGALKPLTSERALQAAKMSGYPCKGPQV